MLLGCVRWVEGRACGGTCVSTARNSSSPSVSKISATVILVSCSNTASLHTGEARVKAGSRSTRRAHGLLKHLQGLLWIHLCRQCLPCDRVTFTPAL